MARLTASQRAKRRREIVEERKKAAGARVVRRGQRATLNGKPVIADGKGNWMPASHFDRYHKDFRKGKPVGTYVVGQDRNNAETAAQRKRRIFPETEAQARKRLAQEDKDRAQLKKDRARGDRAIEKGGGRTGAAYVGTGQPTTKPKPGGTKPAQTTKPKPKTKTKPKTDNRPTTVKEIAGAEAFIKAHEHKKGAMQNAVRQAKERLRRLKAKRAEEVRGNRPRNA